MDCLEFLKSKRTDLFQMEQVSGIPALAAATHFLHESRNNDGSLSQLAEQCHNFAGMKWAEWQQPFGCKPVVMGTWEEVNGNHEETNDAFCACPDWATWLRVYAALIYRYYQEALPYKNDPMLFLYKLWAGGWATDSRYLGKVGSAMTELWDDFKSKPEPWQQAAVDQLLAIKLKDGTMLLNQSRPADQVVSWWEFAIMLERIRRS